MKRRYQYVVSKWTKNNLLLENEIIQSYMPEMRLLTKQNLLDMLVDYPVLYLKPDNGMKGKGIIQLSQENTDFIVRTSEWTKCIPTFKRLTPFLKKQVKEHKYLIQQGISLLSLDHQPIDFRVLVQKPSDRWIYSGTVGKLGVKNGVTTNFACGGKAISFRQTMMNTLNLPIDEIKLKRDELRDVSLTIAEHLTHSYPGLRELGIDFAIEPNGKVWIIEVNTTPGHQLFKFLPNEKIYKRIIRNFRLING